MLLYPAQLTQQLSHFVFHTGRSFFRVWINSSILSPESLHLEKGRKPKKIGQGLTQSMYFFSSLTRDLEFIDFEKCDWEEKRGFLKSSLKLYLRCDPERRKAN